MLRPDLLKSFKPALLGRMTVVPYFPLGDEVLKKIIELQLKQIGDRLKQNHKAAFTYDPAWSTRSPPGARKWRAGPATWTTS